MRVFTRVSFGTFYVRARFSGASIYILRRQLFIKYYSRGRGLNNANKPGVGKGRRRRKKKTEFRSATGVAAVTATRGEGEETQLITKAF